MLRKLSGKQFAKLTRWEFGVLWNQDCGIYFIYFQWIVLKQSWCLGCFWQLFDWNLAGKWAVCPRWLQAEHLAVLSACHSSPHDSIFHVKVCKEIFSLCTLRRPGSRDLVWKCQERCSAWVAWCSPHPWAQSLSALVVIGRFISAQFFPPQSYFCYMYWCTRDVL